MSETICPRCEASKQRISQHWAKSSCGYPEITDSQRALLNGLVLAGATIAGHGTNRHLTIGTTTEALADWVAAELDWLHHGTRMVVSDESGAPSHIHRIRTPAHPAVNRYERWQRAPESRGRIPPAEFELSVRSARVWYGFAGNLLFREYDSQRSAAFSATYDDKAEWIQRILDTAGYDSTRQVNRIQIRPTETSRFLNWMGRPPPGAEHKFRVSDVGERPVWKDQSQYPGRFPDDALQNAVLNAADSFERPPSENEFDEWRPPAYPASKTVVVRADDGWHGTIAAAGLDVAELLRATGGHGARYPDALLLASLREAQSTKSTSSQLLTEEEYREWRRRERERGRVVPTVTTIRNRFPDMRWKVLIAMAEKS
jgi:hypothetical protein